MRVSLLDCKLIWHMPSQTSGHLPTLFRLKPETSEMKWRNLRPNKAWGRHWSVQGSQLKSVCLLHHTPYLQTKTTKNLLHSFKVERKSIQCIVYMQCVCFSIRAITKTVGHFDSEKDLLWKKQNREEPVPLILLDAFRAILVLNTHTHRCEHWTSCSFFIQKL